MGRLEARAWRSGLGPNVSGTPPGRAPILREDTAPVRSEEALMRSTRSRLVTAGVILAGALAGATLVAGQPTTSVYRPAGTARELELAGFAKVLCSAVFVSGRDPAEAAKHSGDVLMPSGRDKVSWRIDREEKIARVT